MSEQSNTSSLPMERSQAAAALDNLIRRHLRVSDPRDPEAISKALRERYVDEQQALEQEAGGLPFFKVTRIDTRYPAQDSTRVELRQAQDDVHKDLTALTTNALLKDIHPELRGWSQVIRQAAADGTNAARFALDPWQRDRAMAARRLLGDYARVARFVGALTPNMSIHYRQLAKSLDEVAGVILVLMGDALANVGYGGGRFLLQAPASELQARRDAVIYALRNLVGTAQESYGPNDWPRGLVAYRQFLSRLEAAGQSELRTLFQENNVARALDELTHFATSGAAEDLRALGATAHLNLGRFQRLILFSQNLVSPSSPPLAAYLSAVQLFLDAFTNGASGFRLLYISRPPITFYGLYGVSGLDSATQRLVNLIISRSHLAQVLDCYLGCSCSNERVRCQIMLDKILYDLDRAIDLYSLGTDPAGRGAPEERAAAYGIVVHMFLENYTGIEPKCVEDESTLEALLERIRALLWWQDDTAQPPSPAKFALDGLYLGPPPYVGDPISGFLDQEFPELAVAVSDVLDAIRAVTPDPLEQLDIRSETGDGTPRPDIRTDLIGHVDRLNRMHQELCLQQNAESQWESLLHTMAPSCFRFNGDDVIATRQLVQYAIDAVSVGDACPVFGVTIPPHFETSLDSLANDVTNTGLGRETI
jgi:hypothetical protein